MVPAFRWLGGSRPSTAPPPRVWQVPAPNLMGSHQAQRSERMQDCESAAYIDCIAMDKQ